MDDKSQNNGIKSKNETKDKEAKNKSNANHAADISPKIAFSQHQLQRDDCAYRECVEQNLTQLNYDASIRKRNCYASLWQYEFVDAYQGDIVRIRPARESDASTSYLWRSDPIVRDGEIGYPFPATFDSEVNNIRSANAMAGAAPHSIIFAIDDIKTKALLGYISFFNIDWASKVGELGMIIGPKMSRGQNIGFEGLRLALLVIFYIYNFSRVWLKVLVGNVPAQRLYEKCDFTYEGCLRQHIYSRGKYRDMMIMGILVKDFLKKNKEWIESRKQGARVFHEENSEHLTKG